ncbi:branched-chain amino acid ABC transporter permease [Actinomadura mexicana]|uniref:Neutral amino acid transport system permease protein n=1 Tax=Actinomadura mexicana TaxID=134959 RepID=A0A238UL81_9ACTN|nr:branched-chain amino acid ABC transporter permease [Actinomadura mexicana]SNR22872.1 neutral amino acid transport system permease protein [Actinomadura mexicana]
MVLQMIVFGVLSGTILALGTVGFAMVRQTQGFLNIAHGQFLALGAYLGLEFTTAWNLNIWVSGVLALLIVGLVGLLLAWVVFLPVRKQTGLVSLFTSVGLAYALYALMRIVFDPSVQLYSVDFGASLSIGSASIAAGELVVLGVAAFSVVALHLFLTYTRLGQAIRAVASNPSLASLRGVSERVVVSSIWFVSSALAGLAGVLLGVVGSVHSEIGWAHILAILAVAVLGGVGSIYGVIAAGLLLGLVTELSALVISSDYRSSVAFLAIVVTLLVRPQGLFAVSSRREVA